MIDQSRFSLSDLIELELDVHRDKIIYALKRDEVYTDIMFADPLLRLSDGYLKSLKEEGYTIYPFRK